MAIDTSPFSYLALDLFCDLTRPEPSIGCFVEGTSMLLESGNEKLIETIKPVTLSTIDNYDPLLSANGSRVYPISVVSGLRPEPHVVIQAKCLGGSAADNELNVQVSANHAFLTTSNKVVQARHVGIGTRLRTRFGSSIVEKSFYAPNESLVWNMFVASEEFVKSIFQKQINSSTGLPPFLANSTLGLPAMDHFIYGNGFLSADLNIQILVGEIASSGMDFSQLGLSE
jgi:hypothetical protein